MRDLTPLILAGIPIEAIRWWEDANLWIYPEALAGPVDIVLASHNTPIGSVGVILWAGQYFYTEDPAQPTSSASYQLPAFSVANGWWSMRQNGRAVDDWSQVTEIRAPWNSYSPQGRAYWYPTPRGAQGCTSDLIWHHEAVAGFPSDSVLGGLLVGVDVPADLWFSKGRARWTGAGEVTA